MSSLAAVHKLYIHDSCVFDNSCSVGIRISYVTTCFVVCGDLLWHSRLAFERDGVNVIK